MSAWGLSRGLWTRLPCLGNEELPKYVFFSIAVEFMFYIRNNKLVANVATIESQTLFCLSRRLNFWIKNLQNPESDGWLEFVFCFFCKYFFRRSHETTNELFLTLKGATTLIANSDHSWVINSLKPCAGFIWFI